MHIIAHLGADDNEYIQEIQRYRPGGCPVCGAPVHRFQRYHRYGSERSQVVPILRFRCASPRCRQVFSVLPSYLVPGQSHPAATEEAALRGYAAGTATLTGVASILGVGSTTVFRWVDRACGQVADWVAMLQRALLLVNPGN